MHLESQKFVTILLRGLSHDLSTFEKKYMVPMYSNLKKYSNYVKKIPGSTSNVFKTFSHYRKVWIKSRDEIIQK